VDQESSWPYWAERTNPGAEVRNFGVDRERTDQIAVRLERSVEGVDALVIQGGINDIVAGLPVGQAAANLRGMVRRGMELGLRVALAEVCPWRGHPEVTRLNELIHEIARTEEVFLLPFYGTLEDPGRPGHMRDEWCSDGNHPSVVGYRRLGELAFRVP